MMTRRSGVQPRFCFVNLEELVPQDHLLRLIQQKIDFSFIYDRVQHLYSPEGRPSIDPVLLFKMLLIGYLYGIPSERRLEQEVKVNLAYRWFLGLEIDDPVPDHSVFSQNRRRRFRDARVFQDIFDHLIRVCIEQGLVSGELVVTDSTHVKADAASGKNTVTIQVTKPPSEYLKELDAEAERLEGGKDSRRNKRGGRGSKHGSGSSKTVEVKVSRTDPDARWLNRKGKPGGYHYLSHQTLDAKHGIIIDVHTTAANVNDHLPYGERLRRIIERFGFRIQQAAADAGYDSMHVHHTLRQLGIQGFIPRQKRSAPAQTFRSDQFHYRPEEDAYRCPNGKRLTFSHISTHRTKQKVYSSRPADCNPCPLRAQCVAKTARVKQITRPLFQDDADRTYQKIGTAAYKAAQRLRRIWCEGTFALQKRRHNLERARMRGRERMQEQSCMSAIAVNLIRMVKAMPPLQMA